MTDRTTTYRVHSKLLYHKRYPSPRLIARFGTTATGLIYVAQQYKLLLSNCRNSHVCVCSLNNLFLVIAFTSLVIVVDNVKELERVGALVG